MRTFPTKCKILKFADYGTIHLLLQRSDIYMDYIKLWLSVFAQVEHYRRCSLLLSRLDIIHGEHSSISGSSNCCVSTATSGVYRVYDLQCGLDAVSGRLDLHQTSIPHLLMVYQRPQNAFDNDQRTGPQRWGSTDSSCHTQYHWRFGSTHVCPSGQLETFSL